MGELGGIGLGIGLFRNKGAYRRKGKVLFICKRGGIYGGIYGEVGKPSSGLRNSASFVVSMLNANGVKAKLVEVTDNNDRLRRGLWDVRRDIQVLLAPSVSRRVIPSAATVLRSLALLRQGPRASSYNDLTPLRGYRGLLTSVFRLPWLVDRS